MEQVHFSKVPIILWLKEIEISHLVGVYSVKGHLWLCKRTFRGDPALIGFVKPRQGKTCTPQTPT